MIVLFLYIVIGFAIGWVSKPAKPWHFGILVILWPVVVYIAIPNYYRLSKANR